MKSFNTRTLAALLLTAVALTAVSCSEGGGVGSPASTTASAVQTAPVETKLTHAVPASDHKGAKFNFLSPSTWTAYEFAVTEENGEIVNDAVYARNKAVEELLNITLRHRTEPDAAANMATYNALITASVLAADGSFDLVAGVMRQTMPVALEGYFLLTDELPYVKLDNPWYVSGLVDTFGINGCINFTLGDADLSMYKYFNCIYFNSDMAKSRGLESPYQYVRDDKWTLDRLIEETQKVSGDLNGDGVIDGKNDLLGLYINDTSMGTLGTSLGLETVISSSDGSRRIAELTERTTGACEKYDELISLENITRASGPNAKDDPIAAFIAGRAYMQLNYVYAMEYLRDMSFDYGLVPMPKYDEAQEDYITGAAFSSTTALFVPNTVKDGELSSMVIETLNYYSWDSVVETYYRSALQDKYSRDSETNEMLALIRAGAKLDFAMAYEMIGGLGYGVHRYGTSIASSYASNANTWSGVLDKINAAYAKLVG